MNTIRIKTKMKELLEQLELQEAIKDLKNLGLNQEDIEGYIDFFYNNWESLSLKESEKN
jgi:DNA-binding transcriptional regulator YhcF (GntR family)